MIRDDFLTNSAYGFPSRGDVRRIVPKVLAVVHITANLAPAQNQRDYADRTASPGPSAHYYIDRDGSGIHAIDERRFAAWSNGDVNTPRILNPGVAYLVALRAGGHNANEGCYLEIECVGTAQPDGQWTDAQFATVAALIADASAVTGIAIDRSTVLGHFDINTVDRPHCPSLHGDVHMAKLIDLAKGSAVIPTIDVTSPTPLLVDVPIGTRVLNLDGSLRLTTTVGRVGVLSPFGSTSDGGTALRAIVWTAPAPTPDLLLAIYTHDAVNARPVPGGDCAPEIAAAISADRAKARIVYT